MNGHLLDTNVISKLTNGLPGPKVTAFLLKNEDLYLSIAVMRELELGLQLLPEGSRRCSLQVALSEFIAEHQDAFCLWIEKKRSGPCDFGLKPEGPAAYCIWVTQ